MKIIAFGASPSQHSINRHFATYAASLFEKADVPSDNFIIQTIADITDDANGSVPINLGDQSIEEPVYGVDKMSFEKTEAYISSSIDIMAVGNLPNELPRDASRYFGEQLIKYILEDLIKGSSVIIEKATIAKDGTNGILSVPPRLCRREIINADNNLLIELRRSLCIRCQYYL